jgi:hypothetical protein
MKSWCGPNFDAEDCTDEEDNLSEISSPDKLTAFWVEDEILQHVFLGMKMELRGHELNIGLCYFDTLGGPYCSFFQVMENEKMVDWKEPGMSKVASFINPDAKLSDLVPNTRPAPSVDDPNAEEAMLFDDCEDDLKDDKKAGAQLECEA